MAAVGVNGPLVAGMYRLKPYYDTCAEVDLPDCMYSMRSVYSNQFSLEERTVVAEQQTGSCSMEDLQRRQEGILARLEELKKHVTKLQTEYDCKSVASDQKLLQTSPVVATVEDIVITAHPSDPPLSVLVLSRLLASHYRVLTSTFVHSSAKNITPPNLVELFQADSGIISNRNAFQIGLTVIWKDVKVGPSLMVHANKQTAICGEANIARYLARLLTPRYDVDLVTATQVDALLDVAATLLRCDASQVTGVLKSMALHLGKGRQWFVGSSVSLADIVLWSAVKRRRSDGSMPIQLQQWLESYDKLPEFALPLKLTS